MERHLRAENEGDVEAAVACFSEDCRYEIPALGVSLRGREAVAAHHRGMFEAFSDWRNDGVELYPAPDRVFARVRVERTHTGTWGQFPPSGKRLVTQSLAEFPVAEDGLLAGEIVHLNPLETLHQLGLIPTAEAARLVVEYRQLRGDAA